MNPQDDLGRHLKPITMVAAAIVASLVVYLALVEVLKATLRPFGGFAAATDIQPFRYAAFGGAAVIILLVLVLRPRLFRRIPGEDPRTTLLRLQKSSLLTLILGEIPAILGLGLFLIRGGTSDFYKLLFASLLLTFIHFPRRGAWEEWLKD